MKYISIDLETTGLDENVCDILEIGAVIDDFANPKPLEELKRFHCFHVKKVYCGDPYALALNANIFKIIEKREAEYKGKYWFLNTDEITPCFKAWLVENGITESFTATGKNFATFDTRFLNRLLGWKENIKIKHRVLDVGSLYFDPSIHVNALPTTAECLELAGMGNVELTHTAIEDCLLMIKLIRKRYGYE